MTVTKRIRETQKLPESLLLPDVMHLMTSGKGKGPCCKSEPERHKIGHHVPYKRVGNRCRKNWLRKCCAARCFPGARTGHLVALGRLSQEAAQVLALLHPSARAQSLGGAAACSINPSGSAFREKLASPISCHQKKEGAASTTGSLLCDFQSCVQSATWMMVAQATRLLMSLRCRSLEVRQARRLQRAVLHLGRGGMGAAEAAAGGMGGRSGPPVPASKRTLHPSEACHY